MIMRLRLTLAGSLIGGLMIWACGGEETTTSPGGQQQPPAPTVASVTVAPASATLVSLGETAQLTASAQDANGTAISGKTFTWSSSDASIATVSSSGLVSAVADGSATITATTDGINGTAAVDVNQVAVQVGFIVEPADAVTGTVITPAVEVAIQDALGNVVTSATADMTVALGTNPSGGTLSGTTTVGAVDGTASFADLSIDQSGPGYTLVATLGTLMAVTSAAFDICGEPAASIDQQQTAIDATVGGLAIGSSSDQVLAQVVTVGRCGLLEEVRFPVSCSVGDLTVEIQGVDGDIPNGTVLTSEVIPGSSLFSADPLSFRSLALSSPAFFSVGARFAIVLKSAGQCGMFQGPVGNLYSGGDAFFDAEPNQRGVWVFIGAFGGRADLPFQTVVR